MNNSGETESVRLEIVSDDEDTTAHAIQQLRTNLRNMDGIEAVERPQAKEDDLGGGKGDALSLGALILAVAPGAVTVSIEFLKEWLLRKSDASIRVKLQRGDQLVELEYNAATTSVDEIKTLMSALTPMDDT
jgi:hypothetical protein